MDLEAAAPRGLDRTVERGRNSNGRMVSRDQHRASQISGICQKTFARTRLENGEAVVGMWI